MTAKIDLHLHTNASDGTMSPEELVRAAWGAGLTTIAVTDHDTVSAVAAARGLGERLGMTVIAGVEISVDYHGTELHILGYGLDTENGELLDTLIWNRSQRHERNLRIAERMRADGIDVSVEALEVRFPGATIGRLHFAKILLEQGRVASIRDAFRLWLNPGCPYYLPRLKLTLAQAAQTIRSCGGTAVLAHPMQYRFAGEALEQLLADCVEAGIAGVEVFYTGYDDATRAMLAELAAGAGCFVTGGSDFHGDNKPDVKLGVLEMPGGIVPLERLAGGMR